MKLDNWIEKRNLILNRDNFTCKECGRFNPEMGAVLINYGNNDREIHEYINWPDPNDSVYTITQLKTNFTFNYTFKNVWPVFPILQVHHKYYIENREQWNYADEALITLCKRCHSLIHQTTKIPVYNKNNDLVEFKKFEPNNDYIGRYNNQEEMTFVSYNSNQVYEKANLNASFKVFVQNVNDIDFAMSEGKNALDRLIKNHFKLYK